MTLGLYKTLDFCYAQSRAGGFGINKVSFKKLTTWTKFGDHVDDFSIFQKFLRIGNRKTLA